MLARIFSKWTPSTLEEISKNIVNVTVEAHIEDQVINLNTTKLNGDYLYN